jgi:hypothetical protein
MTMHASMGDGNKNRGVIYKDKSKPADVRHSNINAAKGKHIFFKGNTHKKVV